MTEIRVPDIGDFTDVPVIEIHVSPGDEVTARAVPSGVSIDDIIGDEGRLPREAARALATQTALGAGRMLREDGAAPAVLRERVTSPNGTTQAALDSFAASGLRETVARAIDAAAQRGRELSANSGT